MHDKRLSRRQRKRFCLKFGPATPDRLAFTEDISAEGLFIRTANILEPGKEICVELSIPDSSTIVLCGVVTWAKRVPGNMFHLVKRGGMGVKTIRIEAGFESYAMLCETLHGEPMQILANPAI